MILHVVTPCSHMDNQMVKPRMFFSQMFFLVFLLPRHRRKKTRSQKAGGKNQAKRHIASMNHLGTAILQLGMMHLPCLNGLQLGTKILSQSQCSCVFVLLFWQRFVFAKLALQDV